MGDAMTFVTLFFVLWGSGGHYTADPTRCISLAPCLAPAYSQREIRTGTLYESGINPAAP
jgi:hypothetical protein